MTPAISRLKSWRKDPVKFVLEVLRVDELDEWQIDFLRAFGAGQFQRLGTKACKGPGKTALLAWCSWNFLATRPHPKVAATSISGDNLADNLWPEMAKWQSRSEFLRSAFQWTKTRIFAREHPETWFMSARTWRKAADQQEQANTLAGLHAEYLLFVIDESGGVPDAVAAAAEGGLATGKETKLIQAGNPTALEGPLYRACTSERHLWYMQEITGDPDDPKRAKRVSVKWAKEQIEKYGRDNPWVLVNVFGKFPPSSLNTLLGPDEVEAAMKRHYRESEYEWAQKRLGVDVARFGDDRTILFPRQGLQAFEPVVMRSARTTDIAARIVLAKERWGWEANFVDDSGHWGHGVIDNLITGGFPSTPVLFEGEPIDPRYKNKRAEMWIAMSEWVKRGGALPMVPELKRELTVPTYTFVNGKFLLEPKDQIKQRIGNSPDLADGLALTFAWPEMPAGQVNGVPVSGRRAGKVESEFNPWRDVQEPAVHA